MSAFLQLARVELSRLLHRRAILVVLAASVLIPVVIGVSITLDTRPPSEAAVADAQAQLERDRNDPAYEEQVQECIDHPEEWGFPADVPAEEIEQQCRENNEPQLEWYLWTQQLDLADERDFGSGIAITLILAIAMMLLGTTFTGHDWASGSVSNQLLFEPRRLRVWFAKALVVTGTAFLVSAAVLTAYWLALDAVAASRDLPSGDALLLDCLQMGWRAAGVAALAALAGLALTMLFRSTVATLGILFGIALAGGLLLGVLGVEGRWNPAFNVAAVISDGTSFDVQVDCPPSQSSDMGDYCSEVQKISFAQGAGYLGATIGATCLASLLWFRRRDVP